MTPYCSPDSTFGPNLAQSKWNLSHTHLEPMLSVKLKYEKNKTKPRYGTNIGNKYSLLSRKKKLFSKMAKQRHSQIKNIIPKWSHILVGISRAFWYSHDWLTDHRWSIILAFKWYRRHSITFCDKKLQGIQRKINGGKSPIFFISLIFCAIFRGSVCRLRSVCYSHIMPSNLKLKMFQVQSLYLVKFMLI